MRLRGDIAPNSAATRSKPNRPTRPQFRPPTISSTSVSVSTIFILSLQMFPDRATAGFFRGTGRTAANAYHTAFGRCHEPAFDGDPDPLRGSLHGQPLS